MQVKSRFCKYFFIANVNFFPAFFGSFLPGISIRFCKKIPANAGIFININFYDFFIVIFALYTQLYQMDFCVVATHV